jgi:hypothetical protein
MKEQGRKLMAMIGTAVNALSNVEAVVPAIQDMGKRHVAYGVKPEDYDSVGAALLWTLEQGLGDDFTPDTKEAWATVYGLVATTMKDAAYSKVSSSGHKKTRREGRVFITGRNQSGFVVVVQNTLYFVLGTQYHRHALVQMVRLDFHDAFTTGGAKTASLLDDEAHRVSFVHQAQLAFVTSLPEFLIDGVHEDAAAGKDAVYFGNH